MYRSLLVPCILALSVCLPQSTLLGDISVDVDDVFTTAGSTVFVDINASSDMGEMLLGTDIPLDIGGDGVGVIPAGLTFVGFTSTFGMDTSGGGPPFEDVLVGGFSFSSPVALPASIVTLEFTVDNSVAVGTVFDIDVINNASLTATDQDFNLTTPTGINGSITIQGTGVPEPGTALVLVATCFAGCLRRRR